ncbi:MAG: hypothetical protein JNL61_00100 [Rhizobiaceae bacterium]|nr:hypothetical protein [Rhizobiaceae bacterium]
MVELSLREAGQAAALRRFPAEHRTIDELMLTSGDFCDMCEELAEAEGALRATEGLPPAVRTERTAEWTAVIDRLTAEIGRALNEAHAHRAGWTSPLKRNS